MQAERFITKFNNLNGKIVSKTKLQKLHSAIKTAIDKKHIDAHVPFGIELFDIEKKLSAGIKKMGKKRKADIELKPIKIHQKKIVHLDGQVIRKKKAKPKAKRKTRPIKKQKEIITKVTVKEETTKIKASAPVEKLQGFTTADMTPEKPKDTFILPGEIGKFLGEQQRYRLQIIIDGQKFSSKSELAKQLIDAFISAGFKVALIDYEHGGLENKDTIVPIQRNVKPENRKNLFVSNADFPATIDALKSIANKFDVVFVDSGTKIGEVTNEWLDTLRIGSPKTIWVIIMQQNAKGGTKGGTAAGYNAPVVIKTSRADITTHKKNFAWTEKNRGNETNRWYLISDKKMIDYDPTEKGSKEKEEKTQMVRL